MRKRRRIIRTIAISISSIVVLFVLAVMAAVRTNWFENFVRQRIVSSIEESTGGRAGVSGFTFDLRRLTATASGFVLHGTEPPGSAPLLEIPRAVVRLRLMQSFSKPAVLEYLGIEQPKVNVIVLPNGKTNIPEPRTKSSNTSGLDTLVNLEIRQIEIRQGSIQFQQQSLPLEVRARDLKLMLAFNAATTHYEGNLSVRQALAASPGKPPLDAQIKVPIELGADAVQITGASIVTPQSAVYGNVAVEQMANPKLSIEATGHFSLDELARSFELPIRSRPGLNTLEASLSLRDMRVDHGIASLGHISLAVSGDLRRGAEMHATVAVEELAELLALPQRPSGTVEIAGSVQIPASGSLAVRGNLSARDLEYENFRDIRIRSGFHADPETLALNDVVVNALGGEIRANAQVEEFSRFKAAGTVNHVTIRNLTTALMTKPLDYGGAIGGLVEAAGDFKGAIEARSHLRISAAGGGVPVSGNLDAFYSTAHGVVVVNPSRIALPHSSIDLRGVVGREADIRIESRSLHDFAPLGDVAPVLRLQGGAGILALHENGPFSDPRISGHLELANFAVKNRRFEQLSANLRVSPSNAAVDSGILKRNSSQVQFSGSVGLNRWRVSHATPLTVNLIADRADAADFAALSGSDVPISGTLDANVSITGTMGNPQGAAQITLGQGNIYGERFDQLRVTANLSDQRVDLNTLEWIAGTARLDARGTFVHPRDNFDTGRVQLHAATNQVNLAQFATLQQERPGFAGTVSASTDLVGDLRQESGSFVFALSALNANVNAVDVRDQQRTYGDLRLSATTYGSDLNTRIDSNFGGSRIQITARTALRTGYATTADASVDALQLDKIAIPAPVTGVVTAQGHFEGTLKDPRADFRVNLRNGSVYDEPVTRMDGQASYSNQLITLSALNIVAPAGRVETHGSYSHAAGDFANGKIELHLNAPGVQVGKIHHIESRSPGLSGTARLTADVTAEIQRQNSRLRSRPLSAEIKGAVDHLRLSGEDIGGMNFEAHTAGERLALKLDANIAGSQVEGTGQVELRGNYPGTAKLTLANLRYSSLAKLEGINAAFEGLVDGQANFSGPFLNPRDGTGDVQISRLELSAKRPTTGTVELHNDGPMVARLNQANLDIQSAKISGPLTTIEMTGRIALGQANPLDLALNANVDLGVIKTFSQNAFSSGNISANVNLRGSFKNPQLTGRIDLKDASLQMEDWPNGIERGNGAILLSGNTARLNSITAQTGGGKLTLDGTVGYRGSTLNYDLRAKGQQIRTRYAGASVTADAALTMSGTTERSALRGSVTITRVGYSQQSDLGAILTATSPPAAPASPNLASRTRLNIHVVTSPGARFQTDLAEQLSATVDLNVLGNLQIPGMVGRADVNSGALIFFGNKYTVNRGVITFYNPNAIQPVLDIDLQTQAQGVSINLGVSGPIDNLKLSYHSDPPLQFDDIVGLLTTGRTPKDPTIAVNQPYTPDQNATQMGESAILSQAIASPVANRLQRVFGVTALKISPTFVSGSTLPQARITIQQTINTTVTFTYSQDLNQANSQLVRVEFALTPKFSAVATRDENGIFGIDFYYKKQFR